MAVLLTRLAGFRLSEALALSFDEGEQWLECAADVERGLRGG